MRPLQKAQPKISPLSSDNYYSWVDEILPELRVQKVCSFVLENLVDEINADESLSEWKKISKLDKDQCALGIIQENCTSTYRSMINRCKTAKEAWDLLASHFTKRGLNSHTDLHKAIAEIKFSWNEGLDRYVQDHRQARQRFEDAGVQNTDSFYLSTFLSNLPEEFDTVIDILENNEQTKTIDDTLIKLSEKFKKLVKKRKTRKLEVSDDEDDSATSKPLKPEKQNENGQDSRALLMEMAETIKLLSAQIENKQDIRTKRRKVGTCKICGGPDTHTLAKCWANPESVHFRPNWSRSIAAAAAKKDNQEQEDDSQADQDASAFIGRILNKKFGKV
jgi:hypothetical protein